MVLERSYDGRSFDVLYQLTADAIACAQPFETMDAHPLPGMNYYRLKAMDLKERSTYSKVIQLQNDVKDFALVRMTPNPVSKSGQATLELVSTQSMPLQLVVSDINGKQMLQKSTVIQSGNNNIALQLGQLAQGKYRITAIEKEGNNITILFVKE